MSSFKNAAKSHQKTHRERAQPAARAHLGHLEKKKDYKLRAEDHHRKQAAIKSLKRKAQDKNPDEFYFQMVSSRLEDGVHTKTEKKEERTADQIKLIHSQDLNYVKYKRSCERKKIERLKSGLHMLDAQDKPQNSHIVFVDTKKQVEKFDAATYLDTHPSLLSRTYNRPKLSTLKKQKILGATDIESMKEMSKERSRQYTELNKRIERERTLNVISQKLEMKRLLLDKKSLRKKMSDETPNSAAVYRWVPQRKR